MTMGTRLVYLIALVAIALELPQQISADRHLTEQQHEAADHETDSNDRDFMGSDEERRPDPHPLTALDFKEAKLAQEESGEHRPRPGESGPPRENSAFHSVARQENSPGKGLVAGLSEVLSGVRTDEENLASNIDRPRSGVPESDLGAVSVKESKTELDRGVEDLKVGDSELIAGEEDLEVQKSEVKVDEAPVFDDKKPLTVNPGLGAIDVKESRTELDRDVEDLKVGNSELVVGEEDLKVAKSEVKVDEAPVFADKKPLTVNPGLGAVDVKESKTELDRDVEDLKVGNSEFVAGEEDLKVEKAEVKTDKVGLAPVLGNLRPDKGKAPYPDKLNAVKANLPPVLDKLKSGTGELEEARSSVPEPGLGQVKLSKVELDRGVEDLKVGNSELIAGEEDLKVEKAELNPVVGEKKVVEAGPEPILGELKGEKVELGEVKAGTSELKSDKVELSSGVEELKVEKGELVSGAGEVKPGLGELEAGKEAVASGVSELVSGVADLKAGKEELIKGVLDVKKGKVEAAAGALELAAEKKEKIKEPLAGELVKAKITDAKLKKTKKGKYGAKKAYKKPEKKVEPIKPAYGDCDKEDGIKLTKKVVEEVDVAKDEKVQNPSVEVEKLSEKKVIKEEVLDVGVAAPQPLPQPLSKPILPKPVGALKDYKKAVKYPLYQSPKLITLTGYCQTRIKLLEASMNELLAILAQTSDALLLEKSLPYSMRDSLSRRFAIIQAQAYEARMALNLARLNTVNETVRSIGLETSNLAQNLALKRLEPKSGTLRIFVDKLRKLHVNFRKACKY